MRRYVNKYILTDILKHAVVGSILSFLLSIFIFMVIGFIDSYYVYDMVYNHCISSKRVGYILFIIVEIIFIIFLIILYRKIKMQAIRKSILSIILFFSTYMLTMLFMVLMSSLLDIDLDIDANAVLFIYLLSIFIFSYITFLLSYIVYIYYQYDTICFNKNVVWKRRIIYTVFYVFCSLIFLLISVILYFVLSNFFCKSFM